MKKVANYTAIIVLSFSLLAATGCGTTLGTQEDVQQTQQVEDLDAYVEYLRQKDPQELTEEEVQVLILAEQRQQAKSQRGMVNLMVGSMVISLLGAAGVLLITSE